MSNGVSRPSQSGPRNPGGPTPPEIPEPRPGWRGWFFLGLLLVAFWIWEHYATTEEGALTSISYTSFFKAVDEQRVQSVTLKGQTVTGVFKKDEKVDGVTLKNFRTMVPAQEDPELVPK